jgi:4-amino-4-deoxy-L-arabinose transferase
MKVKLLIILLIAFAVLTINSGKWGLTESSEARYAEISKEMVMNSDYMHPKLLDVYHYHKPPVTYWMTALGYKLFGINEFGARFFLQVAIVCQLCLIFGISLLLFNDQKLALVAICIYFSLPIVLISSRNLTTDAYLCTLILASIYSWLRYKTTFKVLWLYLFFVFLGLIIATKGPVGLIFVLIFIGFYLFILKEKWRITKHHVFGFLLFTLISSFWYIAVTIENPRLSNYFINKQVVNRVTANSFHRGKPFWYYFAMIPLIGAPWILILSFYYKKQLRPLLSARRKEFVLLLSVSVITIIFSVFKTKLIFYVLPMFGFVAIAAAKMLTLGSASLLKVSNSIIIALTAIVLLSIFVIHFIDIGYYFSLAYVFLLVLIVTAILAILLKSTFRTACFRTAYLSFLFGVTLLLVGNEFLIENESHLNSFKEVADFINKDLKQTENIVVYDYLIPSAAFYSDKNIITLNNGRDTVDREIQFEDNLNWQSHLIDIRTGAGKALAVRLLKDKSVLIARDKNHSPEELAYYSRVFKNEKHFKNWIIFY